MIDIQTILVATDFSDASEAATTYAFRLARTLGVRVYLNLRCAGKRCPGDGGLTGTSPVPYHA